MAEEYKSRCENCTYFFAGECRYDPPINIDGNFPHITENDWCGEHKLKEAFDIRQIVASDNKVWAVLRLDDGSYIFEDVLLWGLLRNGDIVGLSFSETGVESYEELDNFVEYTKDKDVYPLS